MPCGRQPVAPTKRRCSKRRLAATAGPRRAGSVLWTRCCRTAAGPAVTGGAAHCPAAAAGGGSAGGAPAAAGGEPRTAAIAPRGPPRHGAADAQRGAPQQHPRRPHRRWWRPLYLMQRAPHPPRLRSKGAAGCRGPTTTTRCTGMYMRCPAPAGGISPRGRRTLAARVGRGTPAWSPPPTRGNVPASGRRTRTGSRGSPRASAGGGTTARPAAHRRLGACHPPRTHRRCGTQSHMGTACWWPRLRGGLWACKTNTVPWSKAHRRPLLPCPRGWQFFCGRLRRCGLVAGIGGSNPGPRVVVALRGPPAQPPLRRVRIVVQPVPQRSGSPCSPPHSTCCGCWRAHRTPRASCLCRAPSRNATSLPCVRRGHNSSGPAAAPQSGLSKTRRPRSRSSWSRGSRRRKPATSPAPPLGSGRQCRPSPPLCWCSPRQRRTARWSACCTRAAPVQGKPGGARGHRALPAPDPPGALGVLHCGGGQPGPRPNPVLGFTAHPFCFLNDCMYWFFYCVIWLKGALGILIHH